MRLFLLGATGRTGSELRDLALARGHEVTAFVRSPHKLTPAPGLTIVRGSPHDPAALAAALPGHEAVLSAIGPGARDMLRPSTLLTDAAAATVTAMARAGVMRLGVVSAALLFPLAGLRAGFVKWLLRHHIRDLVTMEGTVRQSGLDWTIARPPQLKKWDNADFRAVRDALPPDGFVTSFRSVARFLLEAVEERAHSRAIVGVAR